MSKVKLIASFRGDAFGLFIALADDGRVGVNRRNGQILLDEGDGPDRYHGAVIQPDDFRHFTLVVGGERLRLELHFGEHDVHFLGETTDFEAAFLWVSLAGNGIHTHQKSGGKHEGDVAGKQFQPAPSKNLYVDNLSFDATEGELMELFGLIGKVKDVSLVKDRLTGKSRGFAFVTMETVEDAQAAVSQFHGVDYMGRPLVIKGAHPHLEHSDDRGPTETSRGDDPTTASTSTSPSSSGRRAVPGRGRRVIVPQAAEKLKLT